MTTDPVRLNFDGNPYSGNAIEQGATWLFTFTWLDENKNLIDVSSYDMRMKVKRNYDSDDIHEFSTTLGNIYVDSNGAINISMSANETLALPTGSFIYDFKAEAPNGIIYPLLKGRFEVKNEVTS